MTVRFFFNSSLPKLWGASATTIYPFVFCVQSPDEALATHTISHELVHVDDVRQQGWFSFYFTYIVSFVANLLKTKNYWYSYYNLLAEQKAFRLQDDPKLFERAREVARTGRC